jgi:hypothetical protein
LHSLAPTPALITNALAKPCAAALGISISCLALWRGPAFIIIGLISYALLTINSFFTLSEAEWVGSRDAERRAGQPPEPSITAP